MPPIICCGGMPPIICCCGGMPIICCCGIPIPGCAPGRIPCIPIPPTPARPRPLPAPMAGFPGAAAVGFSGSASPREKFPRDFSSISSMADFGFSGALVGAGAELAMNSPPAKGSIAEGMPIEAPPLLIAPNGSSGGAAVTKPPKSVVGAGAAANFRAAKGCSGRARWAVGWRTGRWRGRGRNGVGEGGGEGGP